MEKMYEQVTKKPTENYHQYLWRLDTLIRSGDLPNWETITPFVNKQLFDDETDYKGESAFRKSVKYARDFYDAGVFRNNSNEEYLAELKEQELALEKTRQKLYATKVEYARLVRQQSRFELFYENIAQAITELPPPEFHHCEIGSQERIHVVGISDIHYGATFVSENNKYSRAECARRFNYLLSYLSAYVCNNQITTLKILNAADTIQGILRMSDLQINDTDVVQCVVEISRLIAEFLNNLSAVCKVEYYHVVQANHSQTRNLGTKASELAGEDLEKIIANYIHDVLKSNPAVDVIFDTTQDYLDFNIFDFQCTLEHGHRVNNTSTFLKDKGNLRRKIYSYGFLGHYHSSQEIIVGEEKHNNVEVLVIPSFIGSDPYADKMNVGAKAMCKIFIFDKKYGHIGDENIILN